MNKMVEQNIANAFEASLALDFSPKIDKLATYSLSDTEILFEKFAGIPLFQPTQQNIEAFIKQYLENDLAPNKNYTMSIKVSVQTIQKDDNCPSYKDKNSKNYTDCNKKGYISDAQGMIAANIKGQTLNIPFIIRDSELLPFDTIQYGAQKVPYTRENFKRIAQGIATGEDKKTKGGGLIEEPYLGVEKRQNPSTSPGFLADVLSIRDTFMSKYVGHGPMRGGMVGTAGENYLDQMLEKVATVKPLAESDFEKILKLAEAKSVLNTKTVLEKLSAEDSDITKDDEILYKRAAHTLYDNAATLPHGTLVRFMEKSGNEIKMTKGVVLDKFTKLTELHPAYKILVSEDSRIKILKNGDSVLCQKITDNDKNLAVKTIGFGNIEKSTPFIIFNGASSTPVLVKTYVRERFPSKNNFSLTKSAPLDKEVKLISAEVTALSEAKLTNIFPSLSKEACDTACESISRELSDALNIVDMDDIKPCVMAYSDFINKKAAQTGLTEDVVQKTYGTEIQNSSMSGGVYVMDSNTPVIPIIGSITTTIAKKEDMERVAYSVDEVFEKIAKENSVGYISMTMFDSRQRLYNVELKYFDKSKKLFNQIQQKFKQITEQKLRAILKILKFDNNQVNDAIMRTRDRINHKVNLPQTLTPQDFAMLQGGQLTNLKMQKAKDYMGKLFDPKTLATMFAVSLGVQAANEFKGVVPDIGKTVSSLIQTKFAEAKELSTIFEKTAQKHKSKEVLHLAKTAAFNAYFLDMCDKTINGDVFMDIDDIAKSVVEREEEFSKTASDLIQLRTASFITGKEPISLTHCKAMVNNIDFMYKMAYAITEKAGK